MALTGFTNALKKTAEIEITVTGRTSGRKISRPVWFVNDTTTLYLLPVKGSDSDWFRNILKTPPMRLTADGEEWTAEVTPITNPAKVREIVDKFNAKYGAAEVNKYYSKFDVAVEIPLAGAHRRSA